MEKLKVSYLKNHTVGPPEETRGTRQGDPSTLSSSFTAPAHRLPLVRRDRARHRPSKDECHVQIAGSTKIMRLLTL